MSKFQIGPMQKKWRDELASGNYPKGEGALCTDGRYCCLGVAAVACGLVPVIEKKEWSFDGYESLAPPKVISALKIRGDDGRFCNDEALMDAREGEPLHLCRSLVELNDAVDSFDPIIKLIDERPELIFTEPS